MKRALIVATTTVAMVLLLSACNPEVGQTIRVSSTSGQTPFGSRTYRWDGDTRGGWVQLSLTGATPDGGAAFTGADITVATFLRAELCVDDHGNGVHCDSTPDTYQSIVHHQVPVGSGYRTFMGLPTAGVFAVAVQGAPPGGYEMSIRVVDGNGVPVGGLTPISAP